MIYILAGDSNIPKFVVLTKPIKPGTTRANRTCKPGTHTQLNKTCKPGTHTVKKNM